jgi:pimeloyl-ACP methyl ester carboxylesterase
MKQAYEAWLTGGQRLALPRLGHAVFTRFDGPPGGPVVTLLHGFPTSSFDWANTVAFLTSAGWRVLTLDFLGFGDSDKPAEHRYSIKEQADLVEELWSAQGVERSAVIAHDYAVSVTQELIARHDTSIDRVVLLNAGVYPDLHRPLLVQRLLRSRLGPLVARMSSERTLARSLGAICERPLDNDLVHDLWQGMSRRDGRIVANRLLHYIDDRKAFGHRWVTALETTALPVGFLWGMRDPVAGAHVLERVRQRMPGARIRAFADVGHYPQLEAPEQSGPALVDLLRDE